MKYCPNCGSEIVNGAKFCVNCGFKLPESEEKIMSEGENQLQEGVTTHEEEPDEEPEDEPKPTLEELQVKYATEISHSKDKKVCAIDGGKIGLLARSIELDDGYFICEKHFHDVFLGGTIHGDHLPNLIDFLEMKNDPNHKRDILPEEGARMDKAIASRKRLDAAIAHSKQVKQEKADKKAYKSAVKCPKCGSTNVEFMQNDHKGFSAGKAIGGAVLTLGSGGIGAVAGFAGKKGKNEWHCNNCGNTFKTK
ncbi:Double zinc ribbon [Lacticaseibacillus paracasei]|uniref:zinc-ribbon domain-containing protein n=1 Tax=Lacticaseibacillus paracasei TaxID=1597 RepID=UPI000FF59E0C|nr:zinc ribbon domain-containing protein [Lacticaseibacillus paracasei]RND70236.1 Double zinc ribbon [Lacticaseibacillus paracasei]RND79742.1 Double zinc ribbon [Lacticaseibacillus paracasei]